MALLCVLYNLESQPESAVMLIYSRVYSSIVNCCSGYAEMKLCILCRNRMIVMITLSMALALILHEEMSRSSSDTFIRQVHGQKTF